MHGARPSLGSAIIVALAAATIGTLFGAVGRWRGGRLDRFAMRLVDVFLSFPYLVLAMAVASSMERGIRAAIIALVIVWWPGYARLVRGMVLSLKSDLHVKAARTLGAGGVHAAALARHPAPARSAAAHGVTLDVGYVLLAIAGLSFLGLAAQNPSPEWGLTIANSKTFVLGAWWYGVFPGVVIGLVVAQHGAARRSSRRAGSSPWVRCCGSTTCGVRYAGQPHPAVQRRLVRRRPGRLRRPRR